VDWSYLGHAGWLVRAGALRILFDPILEDPHHGGTYAVVPPRRVNAEGLRADFLFVSHAHTDHFDVRSLHRLAGLDPETVVVTPDALVEHVASRVGFRTVRRIPPGTAIELHGDVRVVLTPSHASEPEWGVLLETSDGAAWNQVDTVLADPGEVRAVIRAAGLRDPLALCMPRWAPLLEIDAQVPGSLAFPHALYDGILDLVAATGARVVVPASAGQRHVGAAAWLDEVTMPLSERRFLADLAVRAPGIRGLPSCVGATYRVRDGQVDVDSKGARDIVVPDAATRDPRRFRPWSVPPLADATPAASLAPRLERWITDALAPAVAKHAGHLERALPVRLSLSLVFAEGSREWTLELDRRGCSVTEGEARDADVVNAVSASALADVIDGRRAWGDVLLAGEVRATAPAYRVRERGLERPAVAPIFLYYALPYAESARRAALTELDAVLRGEPPPWSDPRGA
jgi:hypothetical protein